MKIAVFGAGSIGAWLAAALHRGGCATSLVARGATLAALRSDGLRIEQRGREQRIDLRAGTATELGRQDLVIVALKAQQLNDALADFRPLLGPDTILLSAMNGIPWWFLADFAGPLEGVSLESVDPGGRAATLFAGRRAIGGVVHASVQAVGPARYRVNGVDKLVLGSPDGAGSATLDYLLETLRRGGIPAQPSKDIRADIWLKLWGNMNMNPLSALARASTRSLLDDPDVSELCVRMMSEMATAGARLGLALPPDPRDRMAMTRQLGDFRPSMLQDIEAGRQLEYAAQLGAVVEIARRLQVPAPFCASILGLTRLLSRSV